VSSCGALIRLAAVTAGLIGGVIRPVAAQSPLDGPPRSAQFLSRLDVEMFAAAIAEDSIQFSSYMELRGEADVWDYLAGRLSMAIQYQAVLGDELQPFDPNQNNYLLEASSSVRAGPTELAGVFHHVSRHLGDRPKTQTIAWNTIRGRALRRFRFRDGMVDVRAEGGWVQDRSFVDYQWMTGGEVVVRRRLSPVVGWYVRGSAEVWGVDRSVAQRSAQKGGRFEGGIRLSGAAGVLELFAGYERVIDADAFEQLPRSWPFAGLRLGK
jgi:hypothetical protein